MQHIKNYHSLYELLEDPSKINAFVGGIVHSHTRKSPLKYSNIKNLDISPELQSDLKKKYNLYLFAFLFCRGLEIVVVLLLTKLGIEYVI
ncbi:hypothetical protein [Methanosalsum natronophilum]|uniref:hypothetical protein n=1 Tax=Methanosalsum natronophilum TaxID=768733 RepID=UPI002167B9A6|nr:hypothetical protein [Methanosalsum natronophilum]MCS3924415.1 hypothetical protein [Methanosalsum natronophilum]